LQGVTGKFNCYFSVNVLSPAERRLLLSNSGICTRTMLLQRVLEAHIGGDVESTKAAVRWTRGL
jgi:hypothetical protein